MFTKVFLNKSCLTQLQKQYFSALAKKAKMELTIRTPYREVLVDFDGFSRIQTKTNEAALCVQNKTPPALYVLPPGPLKIKLTQDVKNVTGDYLHTGGWMIIHANNTCEINVMDLFERKEVKADQFDKANVVDADNNAGKYAAKSRKSTNRVFVKAATS